MPLVNVVEQQLKVGEPTVVQVPGGPPFEVVFEDDGDTGYFYALDTTRELNPICDAMSIYDLANVTDKNKPSKIKIGWSNDGTKAILLINEYSHVIFDFAACRGYCRRNFQPPTTDWTKFGHEWDEDAINLFK